MNRMQVATKINNIGINIAQTDNESTATSAALALIAGILENATTAELILFGKYLVHFVEHHCASIKLEVCRCTHDAASHSDHDDHCYQCKCESYNASEKTKNEKEKNENVN